MQRRNGTIAFLLLAWLISVGYAAQDPRRVQSFVVMGYQGLVDNIQSGQGPYLRTLMELQGVSAERQPEVLKQLRDSAARYPNIMDFADHVAGVPSVPPPVRLVPPSSESVVPTASAVTLAPLPASAYSGDRLENALRHLTRGMPVTVYTNTGEVVRGRVSEYDARRLTLSKPTARSFTLDQIRGIESPSL